jgi:hypothetical protein
MNMNTSYLIRKSVVIGIIVILFSVAVTPSINANSSKSEIERHPKKFPFFNFNQYIDIEYEPYDEELPIDCSVNIPVKVRYWTDIPNFLLQGPFWRIKNLFLFGTLYAPLQTIHLTVVNTPEWCNAYFSQPNISSSIDNEIVEVMTTFIISVTLDAPASPFTITIKAEVPTLKRLDEFTYEESMEFTPEYIPSLVIWTTDTSVETPPSQATPVDIIVKNLGNKKTQVLAEIQTELDGWDLSLNPPMEYVEIGEMSQFTLLIGPPADFDGFQTIILEFTARRYPYIEGSATATYVFEIEAYYQESP